MDAENPREEMTPAERRRRRMLRREKQRNDNVGRAAKMHTARVQMESGNRENEPIHLKASAYVDAKRFETVEINASFYSWPTVANVKGWLRQPGKRQSSTRGRSAN